MRTSFIEGASAPSLGRLTSVPPLPKPWVRTYQPLPITMTPTASRAIRNTRNRKMFFTKLPSPLLLFVRQVGNLPYLPICIQVILQNHSRRCSVNPLPSLPTLATGFGHQPVGHHRREALIPEDHRHIQ